MVSAELSGAGGNGRQGGESLAGNDTVYINGVWVGHTDYQYPPRKYPVPAGLLRAGENTITIRVKCENGRGRFTPDKTYALWNEAHRIELEGKWNYKIGASCEQILPTDFVNWKPTGLFNGMMAPCRKYTIAGFLWYQGESNTHVPDVYLDRMQRMITGYRKDWQEDTLPFLYVQLPNFAIDIYDSDADETGQGWPVVRELQRQAQAIPDTGMAVAIDLGEDNDLHPLNKRDIGGRLAMLAAKKLYGRDVQCEGPRIERIGTMGGQGRTVVLELNAEAVVREGEKGGTILDFELGERRADGEVVWLPAEAELFGDRIMLKCGELSGPPAAVRYCFANTNRGALLYNSQGYPMGPFRMEIPADNG